MAGKAETSTETIVRACPIAAHPCEHKPTKTLIYRNVGAPGSLVW
jgi:hypothetical protein